MAVYAAGFDPTSVRPRVGLILAGLGMSEADSLTAIRDLPGGVTLAFSPYAGDVSHLLDLTRMSEHEYLLSIPMEPEGYPVNDPDDQRALMTSLPPSRKPTTVALGNVADVWLCRRYERPGPDARREARRRARSVRVCAGGGGSSRPALC